MILNALKTFKRVKVFPENQIFIGNIFLKSMKECNNIEAGQEILLAAYMLKLKNYFEIEDEYYKKFPFTFSKS